MRPEYRERYVQCSVDMSRAEQRRLVQNFCSNMQRRELKHMDEG